MWQNLESLPPLSHNVTISRPLPLLTCDVIYGWPLGAKTLWESWCVLTPDGLCVWLIDSCFHLWCSRIYFLYLRLPSLLLQFNALSNSFFISQNLPIIIRCPKHFVFFTFISTTLCIPVYKACHLSFLTAVLISNLISNQEHQDPYLLP